MKQLRIFVALLLSTSGCVYATDVSHVIYCPESIAVTEKAAGVDSAWEVTVDAGRPGYYLDTVRFYSGHPSQMANLVPDSSKRLSNERKTIWNLPNDKTRGYWVACSYQNSRLLVTKKLPDAVKSCMVIEQLLPSGQALKIKSVVCQ